MKTYLNYGQTPNEVLFIVPSSRYCVVLLQVTQLWMAIRIGQAGQYQLQSLCNDKVQPYSRSTGLYSPHTANPYQKTRQVLWLLLEEVVNITKRPAPWNLMCSVKRQSRDIKGRACQKKSCPHNVENTSTAPYTTSDL